jgi:hypothetical protein
MLRIRRLGIQKLCLTFSFELKVKMSWQSKLRRQVEMWKASGEPLLLLYVNQVLEGANGTLALELGESVSEVLAVTAANVTVRDT